MNSLWAFGAKMTSYRRRYDVTTSHRCKYDVILRHVSAGIIMDIQPEIKYEYSTVNT